MVPSLYRGSSIDRDLVVLHLLRQSDVKLSRTEESQLFSHCSLANTAPRVDHAISVHTSVRVSRRSVYPSASSIIRS